MAKQDYDSWDDMRARTWDNPPDMKLPELLGLLGAGNKSMHEQQEILKKWMDTPAARPAPDELLSAARSFLAVPT